MLNGLRVIEFGRFVSAPYCTRLLSDLGAEVVKVEAPGLGDPSRRHGPFPSEPDLETSGLHLYTNLGKLGVTLDVERPEGQDLFRRLIADADVLVENAPPAYLAGLGLGYEQLRELNPRLVMTSITPFGQTGPYKDYKGHDINVCAFAGISFSIGEPGRPPLTMPLTQAEFQGAIGGAAATMAALLGRDTTGDGQHVDVSSTEVFTSLHQGGTVLTYLFQGVTGQRAGHRRNNVYPTTILPCEDGYVCLICMNGRQWHRFLDMVGDPPWRDDPRFQDRRAMAEQYPDEADEVVKQVLKDFTREQFFEMCLDWHLPFAPVRTVDEVLADEHLEARGLFAEVTHPGTGPLRFPGRPYRLPEAELPAYRPAPKLGEHNDLVFGQRLGISAAELATLRETGTI